MLIKDFQLGNIETNCYIVTDENTMECAVIDPGDESNIVLDYLEDNKIKAKAILLTHGHYDHTMAVAAIQEETGCEVYINKKDICTPETANPLKFLPQGEVKYYGDGDTVTVGNLTFVVMETPGHSAGSVVLRCGNCLFTGDTLFKDSCGRTDFPDGSMGDMLASLKRLYNLEGDFEVYPGHMDSSTLERERRFNYYMRHAAGKE